LGIIKRSSKSDGDARFNEDEEDDEEVARRQPVGSPSSVVPLVKTKIVAAGIIESGLGAMGSLYEQVLDDTAGANYGR
jgi:hypothetical protein